MYKKGDLVLVMGSVCDGRSYKDYKFTVAKVSEVGSQDLLVVPTQETVSYLKRPFKVSQRCCQIVNIKDVYTHAQIAKPGIGDLVFIYQKDYKDAVIQSLNQKNCLNYL